MRDLHLVLPQGAIDNLVLVLHVAFCRSLRQWHLMQIKSAVIEGLKMQYFLIDPTLKSAFLACA